MKNIIAISIILFLFLVNACSQKEQEEVELYEKEFQESSENWDVSLYLAELPKEEDLNEENILRIKYLKNLNEEMPFEYELIYGDPPHLSVGREVQIRPNEVFKKTFYDHKMIEEVIYRQLRLVINWENEDGESMEEEFIFKDE